MDVPAEDMSRHKREECMKRKVKCRVALCGLEMFARDREKHENEECRERQVS